MTDWRIIDGDCRDALRSLDAGSVHICVTSPPYYGLRDYGHGDGQDWAAVEYMMPGGTVAVPAMTCALGLEPTPDAFVGHLLAVFRDVRRVLRDDGTVWLNLGDSYGAANNRNDARRQAGDASDTARDKGLQFDAGTYRRFEGMKPKDLLGIPWMVAFALRADGWYLRSEIIWHKPNPMPESVTDRPTKAHEQVFLLSKSPRYFYDADAIREDAGRQDMAMPGAKIQDAGDGVNDRRTALTEPWQRTPYRNKRSVWTVATQPYAGAHFATFPPKLIEPCILAGCPERCCGECGAPWERVVERTALRDRADGGPRAGAKLAGRQERGLTSKRTGLSSSNSHNASTPQSPEIRTVGFEPSCDHDAASIPGTVLDPFAGAGTTGMVALRHGRSFTGIELNPEYAQLARDRIETDQRLGYRAPKRVTIDDGQASIFDALDDAA